MPSLALQFQRSPRPKSLLPAAVRDIASRQGSLTSAMCDLMQALIPPVPGTTPAHSFATSALHTFPVTATVYARCWQLSDSSVKCALTQALSRPSPGAMPAQNFLISPAQGAPVSCATAAEPDSSSAVNITSPDRIPVILNSPIRSKDLLRYIRNPALAPERARRNAMSVL